MANHPKILVGPPGPKASKCLQKDAKYISSSYQRFYPLVVKSAKDCIVQDVDGNEYIDFNSGLCCANVGHCHPKVVRAIQNQSNRFLHYSGTDFYYSEICDIAEKIAEIVPGKFSKKVYFGNSGAETIEAAVKLAKWHTRKQLFIAFTGGFHGRTIGALSFTSSKPVQRSRFFPLMPGVTHVPYPYCYRCAFSQTYPECNLWCVDFIDELVIQKYVSPSEVSAILFEPIQGEGGYIVPPSDYFARLKKLADKYDLLLIDDEVQSGIGRTGKWFAIEHWGIEPEIVCTSKGLASGLPIGAVVANANIMDWTGGSHASTFSGNPLSCAAAKAVLKIIESEGLLDNAKRQGEYIMKRLKEFEESSKIIGDVRGKGLMIGIELVEDKKTKEPASEKADKIIQQCWKQGVLLITCGHSTLRIAPPLTIKKEIANSALDIIENVIRQVEKES